MYVSSNNRAAGTIYSLKWSALEGTPELHTTHRMP